MANCFVVSHKTLRCALSLPSIITNKSLEKLQDFFSQTETKTKCSRIRPRFGDPRPRPRLSFLIVLEGPRDQDHGLEDYIADKMHEIRSVDSQENY